MFKHSLVGDSVRNEINLESIVIMVKGSIIKTWVWRCKLVFNIREEEEINYFRVLGCNDFQSGLSNAKGFENVRNKF